eukprot:scaffold23370_cov52-Prasinocladus_malaysianus.AAC.1
MKHRLAQQSTDVAQRVVCPTLPLVHAFAEEQSAEIKDRIFDEFNTLSHIKHYGVHRAPASTFLDKEAATSIEQDEVPEPTAMPAQ